jgi:hypothetical protein
VRRRRGLQERPLAGVRAGIPVMGYVGSYHGMEKQEKMREALLKEGAFSVVPDWTEFRTLLGEFEAKEKP